MESPKKLNVFAYCRVGNKDQLGNGVSNQKNCIDEYLKKKGNYEITNYYIDNGYSGTNFNRPMFQKMCEEIKKNKVNAIAVYDYSRISRNVLDLISFTDKLLSSRKIELISVINGNDYQNIYEITKKIIPHKRMQRGNYSGR